MPELNLLEMFDDLERNTDDRKVVRAPFGYLGGKYRSLNHILPMLPYSHTYVEPFGGSACVLLARRPSKLEAYNDRFGGVVAFYRCLRDNNKMQKLIEWLELTVHSREDFYWCKESWVDCEDDVERAARWYYMHQYSFSNIGRNWGRSLKCTSLAGKVRNKLKVFPEIHVRFKDVQVDNQDWYDCLMSYDSPETVFYLDPPYLDAHAGAYKNELNIDEHRKLIHVVGTLEGFVALSGYPNDLYENADWDNRIEWEVVVSSKGLAFNEKNHKADQEHLYARDMTTEVLWIKEAR